MKRRELFSSLTSVFGDKKQKQEIVIRPPYYKDISTFDKECIECDGVCSTFCEEEIIFIDADKRPRLNLNKSGCTFCDECAKSCEKNVLSIEYKANIDAKISIDMLKCLSWNSTMCFSCKDPCLDNAIDFLAMFRPTINSDKCTSCGFCIKQCPVEAIKVEYEQG